MYIRAYGMSSRKHSKSCRLSIMLLNMPLLIRIFFINLLLVVVCSGVCRYNDPNINEYFQIFCTKSKGHVTKLVCTNPESPETWSNLPRLNVTGVKLNMDRCRLPADLQLADLFRSMQLGEVVTFQLTNSSTIPTRKNFQDLIIDTIELENCPLEDLPSDLLHYTQPRSFYLVKTMLRAVPHNFFSNSNTIFKVEIVNSRLEKLKREDFKGLINVHTLLLFGNVIDEIEAGTFDTLLKLKSLDLSRNRLKTLPGGLFQNIPTLEIINIGANQFDELPGDLFRKNDSRLRKFRMSLNEGTLKSLPAGLFRDLRHIQQVEALSNRFESIPADVFSDSTMQSLNISENHLTELPATLFSGNYQLKEVWIMANNLTALPDGLFDDTILEVLQLSNNLLTNITSGAMRGLSALKRLYLSSNRLRYIDPNICNEYQNHLEQVEVVDVSRNQLTLERMTGTALDYVFQNCISIRELYASNNNVPRLFHEWLTNTNLQRIDFEGNNITHLSTQDLNLLNHEAWLNLKRNPIKSIELDDIEEVATDYVKNNHKSKSIVIEVSQYPLNCDCRVLEFVRYSKGLLNRAARKFVSFNQVEEIKCSSPPHLANISLLNIDMNDLKCPYEPEIRNDVCSDVCTCWDYPNRNAYAVNCSSKKIEEIPFGINHVKGKLITCASPPRLANISLSNIDPNNFMCPFQPEIRFDVCKNFCTCWHYPNKNAIVIDCSSKNLEEFPFGINYVKDKDIELNLSHNKFNQVDESSFTRLLPSNVVSIDMSSNNISRFDIDFSNVKNIKLLKLHRNNLTHLSSNVLLKLQNQSLKNITLHENPWACNCDTLEFLEYIQTNFIEFHLQEVRCASTGLNFTSLTANGLCANHVNLIIGGSLSMAILGVIFGYSIALYFKYNKEIKIWLYSKRLCLWFITEDDLDKDRKYDVFISFANEDHMFVATELVPRLESGANPYKLCLHYRDWRGGELISDQIVESVRESRRTIIVLSTNFINSHWSKQEFQTAQYFDMKEKRVRLIIIIYGTIKIEEITDTTIKAYLSTNTYIKWGDPWFWEKLYYALPHKNELPVQSETNSKSNELVLQSIMEHKNFAAVNTKDAPIKNLDTSVPLEVDTDSTATDAKKLLDAPDSDYEARSTTTISSFGGVAKIANNACRKYFLV
ncbi:hypothetical protein TKK_0010959 [Trichogramma kaykai]|uniref:TIR domain-containing protein n=1 Tax=Trichogramma kaykai TaxID=54128 RepID=A0ABD2WVM8_9HYME